MFITHVSGDDCVDLCFANCRALAWSRDVDCPSRICVRNCRCVLPATDIREHAAARAGSTRTSRLARIVTCRRQSVTDLHGVRVALLEARMGTELAELVQRYGGVVRSAPAVREAPLDCADIVADFLTRLRDARPPCACLSHRRRRDRAVAGGRTPEPAAVRRRIPEARNDRVPRTEAGRRAETIRPEPARIRGVAIYKQRAARGDGGHRSR